MANEIRKRTNFLSGTITNNPLAAGGTTLNAAALADLEAITSTEHAVCILDPLGAGNGPDIAYVTAHTAAATSATIARSKEGTTGAEHATGTAFVIGPVESDWVMAKPSAELPGTPYYAGQLVVDTDGPTLKMGEGDLSAFTELARLAEWGSWTPTITQSATPSTSAKTGRYVRLGNLVLVQWEATFSGAGTASNEIRVSNLPVTPRSVNPAVGAFWFFDTGNTNRAGTVLLEGSNSRFTFRYDGFGAAMGAGDFAIANGDAFAGYAIYEAA